MPFINSKVTVKMTEEKKEAIKSKLGEAVASTIGSRKAG